MPRANLTRGEQERIGVYFELLQRYQSLDAAKAVPLIAVRTLCVRRGYDRVMGAIGRWGEDIMVNYARDELTEMARLWAYMVHEDPPVAEHREEIMNCIKMTRDAANDPDTVKRIHAVLARCNLREIWLRQLANSAQRKAH